MSNPYTPPTLTDYNAVPPSDDGTNSAANEVTWAGIKEKLADPLKNYSIAIDSAITSALAKQFLNGVTAESSSFNVAFSDRGKLFSCTNSITASLLAASTAGDGFAVAIRNSGTGTVTIDGNASELINGAVTMTLNAGEMVILVCNGSLWYGMKDTPVIPNFCVTKSGNQSISTSTPTLVTFETEGIDNNNNFSSSRFTPTVAGKYQINMCLYFTNVAAAATDVIVGLLYKNGSGYMQVSGYVNSTGSFGSVSLSTIVSMNGTSDYVEIYADCGTDAAYTIQATDNAPVSSFSGHWVGP